MLIKAITGEYEIDEATEKMLAQDADEGILNDIVSMHCQGDADDWHRFNALIEMNSTMTIDEFDSMCSRIAEKIKSE